MSRIICNSEFDLNDQLVRGLRSEIIFRVIFLIGFMFGRRIDVAFENKLLGVYAMTAYWHHCPLSPYRMEIYLCVNCTYGLLVH